MKILIVCGTPNKKNKISPSRYIQSEYDKITSTIELLKKALNYHLPIQDDIYYMNKDIVNDENLTIPREKYIFGYFGIDEVIPDRCSYLNEPFDCILFINCPGFAPYAYEETVFGNWNFMNQIFKYIKRQGYIIIGPTLTHNENDLTMIFDGIGNNIGLIFDIMFGEHKILQNQNLRIPQIYHYWQIPPSIIRPYEPNINIPEEMKIQSKNLLPDYMFNRIYGGSIQNNYKKKYIKYKNKYLQLKKSIL